MAFTYVDLFSGGGGLSRGFLDAGGYEHLLGIDYDADAVNTYRENIGDGWRASLRHVATFRHLPVCDVQIGGPPCQPFSIAGKGKGASDVRNGWPSFLLALRYTQARAFVAENVSAMSHAPNRSYLSHILTSAKRLGYHVRWRVLDAADYGVPQHRKRLFLVGFRDASVAHRFAWPLSTHSRHGDIWTRRWVSAADVLLPRLSNRTPDRAGLPKWLRIPELEQESGPSLVHSTVGGSWHNNKPSGELLLAIDNGQEGRRRAPLYDGKGHRTFADDHGTRYGQQGQNWQPLDWPAFTMTASCGQSHRVVVGENVWRLLNGDMAALQSFPDDWHWHGKTVASVNRQIGNAVPPLLARAIAESVASTLSYSRQEVA